MPETFDVAVQGAIAHAVTWSFCAGKTYVTLATKACFDMARGDEAVLVPPESLVTRDVFVDRDPNGSLLAAVESAPYLASAAVLLHGIAHGPPHGRHEPFALRLALFGRGPLIDKTLRIEDLEGRGVALHYENALRTADNPLGAARPAITDPHRPTEAVGFGPLGPASRMRTQFLRGGTPPTFSETLDLGREFDSRYWNPAPLDQQPTFLQGGETLLLEGLGAPRRVTLPRITVSATCEMAPGRAQPIKMSADMLVIDAARARLSIVWRAIVLVPNEARAVRLLAALTGDPAALVPHEPQRMETTGEIASKPRPAALPFRANPEPERLDQTAAPRSRPKKNPTLPFDMSTPGEPRSAVPPIPATPFDPAFQPRAPAPATGDATAPPWSRNDAMRAAVAKVASGEMEARATPREAVVAPVDANLTPDASTDAGRALVLARIAEGGSLLGIDLSGADLHDLDLSHRCLIGSTLDRANLEGANLSSAKLGRVTLTSANLEDAHFIDADLEGAVAISAKVPRAAWPGD